ncbi:chitobiosyldiphosphodolichol beta-mannosyltransferase-like [Corticium candelabrum]|uniref:chitobiosyldiphosphodolichol beta-mannosyltransferase-like n=1 Tax=Corticium candelabrum TaxID=121492 RepID=UPI002E275509|nr:chitobiosyldiphosphodolichol beta-mannosyltransferase-like [Corticium candelabrum]
MHQHVQLPLVLLLRTRKPGHFLLQNPPAIPTLSAVWLVCLLTGSRMTIDWHNYGYSILQLALKPNHPLVFISKWYEKCFGRLATNNICVTKAMKEDLVDNWGIRASTMYDRPPAMFKKTSVELRHELFLRLSTDYVVFKGDSRSTVVGVETAFTRKTNGNVHLRSDRPFLVISSTSWTEDEDFSVLLQALEMYEQSIRQGHESLPSVVCVITGKGPLKSHYERIIAEKQLNHVKFCLPWLEPNDYPVLLGSADLGVCLHVSSSGLDLPMKVVDMFGCGLPVCAIHFKCLHELVVHEHNGLVFHNSQQLAKQLQSLASGFPDSQERLETFRGNLKSFQNDRWQDSWNKTVLPLFKS